jgi:hypothetical protein
VDAVPARAADEQAFEQVDPLPRMPDIVIEFRRSCAWARSNVARVMSAGTLIEIHCSASRNFGVFGPSGA